MSDQEPKAFNLRGREEGARPELDDLASLRASEGGSSRSYLLVPASQGSEASTSDSNGPVCKWCGKPKPTPTGGLCCEQGSPESNAPTTSVQFVSENQRAEVLLTDYARQLTTGGGKPGQGYPTVLISSVEGSPARTCPSPDDAQGSQEPAPACSSSSPESQTTLFGPEGLSSLRTYPDYFPATTDEILPSYSRRWPTSGFTTSPGECWTADTSECPNDAAGCSSLADVLQETVARKYFLSPKAAAGILRRAETRGKALPTSLRTALEALSRALSEVSATADTAPPTLTECRPS